MLTATEHTRINLPSVLVKQESTAAAAAAAAACTDQVVALAEVQPLNTHPWWRAGRRGGWTHVGVREALHCVQLPKVRLHWDLDRLRLQGAPSQTGIWSDSQTGYST